MGMLTSLASLRTLRIGADTRLPSCLSTLTGLEQLATSQDMGVDGEALEAALPNLQRLTCLSLFCQAYMHILPTIASLPHLQRLCFDGNAAVTGADLSLPQGAWLASIRWLGLPWEVLEPAVGTLQGAPNLEYLCSLGNPIPFLPEEWRTFWRFVATHPPLRCLGVECEQGEPELGPLLDTILALKQRRPDLQLRRLGAAEHDKSFCLEVLDCPDIPSDPVPSSPF